MGPARAGGARVDAPGGGGSMGPAGQATEDTIDALAPLLSPGDARVDGGKATRSARGSSVTGETVRTGREIGGREHLVGGRGVLRSSWRDDDWKVL